MRSEGIIEEIDGGMNARFTPKGRALFRSTMGLSL
jgi:hypothetical protein